MTIVGSFTMQTEQARAEGMWPAILPLPAAADQGELPGGLLVAEDAGGELVPYIEVAAEQIGSAGNGTNKTFADTLAEAPVLPGSVTVSAEIGAGPTLETFSDDGFGNLSSDGGGTGTVNYQTGAISVTFNTAPLNTKLANADYCNQLRGVLDTSHITTAESGGSPHTIILGPVKHFMLKVGATAKAAPSAAALKRLVELNIFPV